MRCCRGQGTVEYLAVVLLVALVAGAAAIAAPAEARDIARAVPREVIRALCLVSGGDCDRDREACPVTTRSTRAGATLRLAVLRLGRHHLLLEEERSDGTVALTLVEEREGGVEAGTGARAALRIGTTELAAGGSVRAGALARAGDGRTWIVPAGAAADALRARVRAHFRAAPARDLAPGFLDREVLPALPAPSETFGERGLEVSAGGRLARGTASLAAGLSAEDVAGTLVDRVTGRRTLSITRRNALEGSGAAGGVTAQGTGALETEYALTVDRDGRPVDLAVIETGSLSGSVDLPPRLQPAAGLLGVPSRGRRLWVSETHLDLDDPESLAVASRAIAALRDPRPRLGDAVAVSAELERRLAERGVVHARTYGVEGGRYGGEIDVRAGGVGAGVDVEAGSETARLLSAATRGIDGEWRTREDCLAARG
jgi:hypothetical protein